MNILVSQRKTILKMKQIIGNEPNLSRFLEAPIRARLLRELSANSGVVNEIKSYIDRAEVPEALDLIHHLQALEHQLLLAL